MQFKSIFLFLLIQLVWAFNINAQKLDSLLRELDNHKKEDTLRLKLLNRISKQYLYLNPKKGLEAADNAIALAEKLNKQKELAYAFMVKGEHYNWEGGSSIKALECLQKALNSFKQMGSKAEIASCLNDMGGSYFGLADYRKASDYLHQALSMDRELDDKESTAIDLCNIALAHLRLSEFNKALDYDQQALDINSQLVNKTGMAKNLSDIGLIYIWLSEFPKALEYNQKALKLSEEIGNKSQIAIQLSIIGDAYVGLGNYPKALENQQESLRVNEQLDFKPGMAANLTGLANIYDVLLNYPMALEYHKKALNINMALNDKQGIAINNLNIGLVYQHKADYTTALKYEQNALDMAERLGSESIMGTALLNIGINYQFLRDYIKALEYYKKSLTIAEKIHLKEDILTNINNMGEIYRDAPDSVLIKEEIDYVNRYSITLGYFNKALKIAEEIATLPSQRDIWHNINITNEKQNDFVKALESYKKFISLRDSIINNEKEKKIARLVMQNEFNKKDDSIKLQVQIADEKLKQQVLLAGQQQQKLELNENELALSNKEKDLQKLAYQKTQADLKNEQLEKKGKEKQLTISEKEKQLQLINVKTLTQEKHLNAFKQQQQWFYIIGGLILFALASLYFFYRTRLHEGRLKTEIAAERIEQHQKEAEFQRQLGDISLSALRSQMNPHFIFNCLNSIKLYTTQNDTVAASEYLTKFSRLIRLVLENSRNDRITLASELDALRLYMEMETMRFKEKLKYNIAVEKDVDLDYIEIPPLLLQPYVENAIWHGLMQKEEGGRIDITVTMEQHESMLAINIVDDGIGRAKAAELKSKTATKHKSYGMKVTSERLALINQIYKSGANVTIHDLADDNGRPAGTRVTIKIPLV